MILDERLSELIGLIYEASLQPELWPSVLEEIAAITPAIVVMLGSHDRRARIPAFYQSHGNDPAYLKQYIERWAASNPMIDAMALLDPGDVAGLQSLLDYEAFTQTAFFQEWARPQGYCDAINIILERTPSSVSSVSVITSEAQGMADAQIIRRLRLLAPHLRRAVRIGRVLDHASVETQTLAATLDALASSVFLLGPDLDLFHANVGARNLAQNGLTIDRLKAALKSCMGTSAATGASGSGGIDKIFLMQINGGEHLICHALSLPVSATSRFRAPLTLIAVRNATSTEQASKLASTVYRLTRRERDVLFGIVEVGGVDFVAATLGLTNNTVRSHLKSLFQKTQTHRQSDLVKLVGTLESPFRQAD